MRIWLLLLALLAPVGTTAHLPLTGIPSPQVVLYELAPAPVVPAIKARAAILVELDTGATLFARDGQSRPGRAGMRKGVTCQTALYPLGSDRVLLVPASSIRF